MTLGERIRAEESYGLLFFLIILSLIATAVAGGSTPGRGIAIVLQGLVLLFALWTTRSGRLVVRVALVLVPLAVVMAGAAATGDSDRAEGVVALTSAALAVTAIGAIVRRLASHPRVDGQTILGALSIYLLIGTFFAALYRTVAAFSGEPFFGFENVDWVDYVYFSFVTLTTTGYGDLTAATDLGRMLAVTEALLGQLYLVSVVALVVGNLGRERIPRESKSVLPNEPEDRV